MDDGRLNLHELRAIAYDLPLGVKKSDERTTNFRNVECQGFLDSASAPFRNGREKKVLSFSSSNP
jgi:hypothetical protein